MKYASDFRTIARDSLKGRWVAAVVAGVIASLLGAISTNGPKVDFNLSDSGADLGVSMGNQQLWTSQGGFLPELQGFLSGGVVYLLVAAIIMAVLFFVLGSVISVGYSRFNLDLVDRQKEPEVGTLFGFFSHWKTAALANLLQTVYVFLWSLLFIIPGIVASYSYAMTDYILAEDPTLAPSEAIERSKEMMAGNRFRLFCLQCSFIGWSILAALTLGIGNLWLTPYRRTATAAFYREISGTEYPRNDDYTE